MKQEIKELHKKNIKQKKNTKEKKVVDIEDMWVELWDTMGRRHRHVIDEDDDNDDVYMYPIDMHLDE